MGYVGLILGSLGAIIITILWRELLILVWRPYVITKRFRKQGVNGPKYKFWSGCLEEIRSLKKAARDTEMDVHSHDIIPRVLPHYFKWMNQYGGRFLYWIGSNPRICITDAEQAKQVLSNKFGFYTKIKPNGPVLALLGRGLVLTDGSDWARHRRVVSPAFTMDKLKIMVKKMAECTESMLDTWHDRMVRAESIEVNQQFQELTADVISHAAFGSSYIEGKEVFLAQKELQFLVLASMLNRPIPGYSYLPTKLNLKKWELERKMRNALLRIIDSRLSSKGSGYGNDLLGIMLEATQKQEGMQLNTNEIIDECKTFFFAGHETTSHLLTWTVFLLSTNQEWQEKLREEVIRECGVKVPNADNLTKFKLVTMVLMEALRLYCPVIMILRQAAKDMNLGGFMIPKGTSVTIPFAIIHLSKELWGDDANKFNPLRFENGINKAAKHPNALLAFSMGPRACVGQNFSMLEAKTVIAMILQRFSFSLSQEYKHKPADLLTLQPQNGLPIVFKPLVTERADASN
ncbi:cytochrome P450 709B2-like [Asparagus officinalis]|uniref:cytochrome P450 709B2-like n=1 Tax=Asparagus officinalis TaxID=4686 RepID=UPI00098DFA19|nr:cytochrome P450 709B2-like [Asparagus officinalis]